MHMYKDIDGGWSYSTDDNFWPRSIGYSLGAIRRPDEIDIDSDELDEENFALYIQKYDKETDEAVTPWECVEKYLTYDKAHAKGWKFVSEHFNLDYGYQYQIRDMDTGDIVGE